MLLVQGRGKQAPLTPDACGDPLQSINDKEFIIPRYKIVSSSSINRYPSNDNRSSPSFPLRAKKIQPAYIIPSRLSPRPPRLHRTNNHGLPFHCRPARFHDPCGVPHGIRQTQPDESIKGEGYVDPPIRHGAGGYGERVAGIGVVVRVQNDGAACSEGYGMYGYLRGGCKRGGEGDGKEGKRRGGQVEGERGEWDCGRFRKRREAWDQI